MQHRIKRDPALFHLISEYENMSRKGHLSYFEDKDLFQLINYYEDEHALDKALEVVDLALNQYTYRSDFYTIKARLLLILGDVEEAMELLEYAENIAPFELEIKLLKARAYSELGCTSDALELVGQARQIAFSSELLISQRSSYQIRKSIDWRKSISEAQSRMQRAQSALTLQTVC